MRPAGKLGVSGALAGLACGLFGGGGGMVLAPLLTRWCHVEEKRVFANCVAVIFPLCALSAGVFLLRTGLDFGQALQLAVDFTLRAIELTRSDSQATWYGVEFERAIPWLTRRLEELGK